MTDRELARALVAAAGDAARLTRANRRGKVESVTADGRLVVRHRTGTLTLSSSWAGAIGEGQDVQIGMVDGVLQVTGPSAYWGGA